MFSIGEAKTFPFASEARHVGGLVGSTIIVGPLRSDIRFGDVHESSSDEAVVFAGVLNLVDAEGINEEDSVCLRFLEEGFLSPLKESGLTGMLVRCKLRIEVNKSASRRRTTVYAPGL